jgi:hypothetical protein
MLFTSKSLLKASANLLTLANAQNCIHHTSKLFSSENFGRTTFVVPKLALILSFVFFASKWHFSYSNRSDSYLYALFSGIGNFDLVAYARVRVRFYCSIFCLDNHTLSRSLTNVLRSMLRGSNSVAMCS